MQAAPIGTKDQKDPFRPVQYERSLSVLQLSDNFIQTIFEQYGGKCHTQNCVDHHQYLLSGRHSVSEPK